MTAEDMPARRRRFLFLGALGLAVASVAVWGLTRGGDDRDPVTAEGALPDPVGTTTPTATPVEPPVPTTPSCAELREPAPVIDGPLSADPDVADQQRARSGFGFASDEATVAAILEAGPPVLPPELTAVGQDLAFGLGLSLTAEEVQDMHDRQSGPVNDASMQAINAFAASHPDTYLGVWIDQGAGGVLRVAVTGDLDAQWAELEPTLPEGHRVEIQPAAHSLSELEDYRDQAQAVVDDLGLLGYAEVHLPVGVIAVSLTSDAGFDPDELADALTAIPACIEPAIAALPEPDDLPESSLQPGFRTHARFPATDEMGTLDVAITNDEVAALWPNRPELGPPPTIIEQQQLLLRFTVPDDACPEIFGGLALTDATYSVTMLDAGYQFCNEPLIPRTYIVSIDRADHLPVGAGMRTIGLPADEPFHDEVTVAVELADVSDTPTMPSIASSEPVPLTENRGEIPLPMMGTAAAALLDDGTPVAVVAHHDGAVSVLDLRVPPGTHFGDDGDPATHALTTWWGGAGRFIGSGAWDRYGRALDNGPHADLQRYEAEIIDGLVRVGQPATARIPGDPIVAEEAFGPNADPILPPLISLTDALATPPGTVSQIDATAVLRSDIGGRICTVADQVPVTDLETCPEDAPIIDDMGAPSPDGRLWTTWFHGPILAERTATGFTTIVGMGGRSGAAG